MIASEIRRVKPAKNEMNFQNAMLQEIAAQLAELNDHLRTITSTGNELAVRVWSNQ